MSEDLFFEALKELADGNWFLDVWGSRKIIRHRDINNQKTCPVVRVALLKSDGRFQSHQNIGFISAAMAVGLAVNFAAKVAVAADDWPDADQQIRGRLLSCLSLAA